MFARDTLDFTNRLASVGKGNLSLFIEIKNRLGDPKRRATNQRS